MTTSYADRFQARESVQSYESQEYGPDSYSTAMWQLQQTALNPILAGFKRGRQKPLHLLDFACGTGRILSFLERFADKADGVDISESMVALARKKCRKASFHVGDILATPQILQGPYDLISCFRFILNVEPEIRSRVLGQLRTVLHEPDGLLLVSVHGNSHSLRHPAIVWRRWRERRSSPGGKSSLMLNEMSPSEAQALLWNSGFEVVGQLGFGILPQAIYRTPLRPLALILDKMFATRRWCKNWCVDLIFLCKPRI